MSADPHSAERWLRGSVALVWLITGLSVAHPYYRDVGEEYLGKLGLPAALMWLTCAGEVWLGLCLLAGRVPGWVHALQAVLILGFTGILAWSAPELLTHPHGVLSKNLPLLCVIGVVWLLPREGWSRRCVWLLRGGMAVVWITEGLVPKILFPEKAEVELVEHSGLAWGDAATFLRWVGVAEVASGVLALVLRGRALRALLYVQCAALVVLPVLVTVQRPELLVHPFGPLSKNIPILVGTWVLARRPVSPPS
jgi:uncharacterized membrane protein YphA (DoxX/SURF4 family)